jgi:hypothetical protein
VQSAGALVIFLVEEEGEGRCLRSAPKAPRFLKAVQVLTVCTEVETAVMVKVGPVIVKVPATDPSVMLVVVWKSETDVETETVVVAAVTVDVDMCSKEEQKEDAPLAA